MVNGQFFLSWHKILFLNIYLKFTFGRWVKLIKFKNLKIFVLGHGKLNISITFNPNFFFLIPGNELGGVEIKGESQVIYVQLIDSNFAVILFWNFNFAFSLKHIFVAYVNTSVVTTSKR